MRNVIRKTTAALCAAVMVSSLLTAVSAEVTDEELSAVNSATDTTIADAVSAYTAAAGKDSLYSVLPECDRTEINARILAGIPFNDTDELAAAYEDAVSKTVKTDTDIYNEYLYEDFSSGSFDTNGWIAENDPYIAENEESISGTTAHALTVDENDSYSMYTAGGSIADGIYRSCISKAFDEKINGIFTVYFYDANNESENANVNKTHLVQVGDSETGNYYYLGVQGNSKYYVYRPQISGGSGALAVSTVARSEGWHKIEFVATSGIDVKGYIDGKLIAAFDGMTSIDTLQIGNWRSDLNDWSYFSTDNISVSVPKSAEEILEELNSADADTIAEAVSMYTAVVGKADLYDVLPECDRTEINTRILAGIPFSDADELAAAYDDAVSKTVKTDTDLYNEYLYENFASGAIDESIWTVTGSPKINEDMHDEFGGGSYAHALPVDAGDNMCMYTSSANLGGGRAYGDIAAELEAGRYYITLYFYDTVTSNNMNSRYAVEVSDQFKFEVYGDAANYVRTVDGTRELFGTARTTSWHKLVFDSTSGGLKAYIDGKLYYNDPEGEITRLRAGNWNNADNYMYFSTDCISISVPKSGDDMLTEFNADELSEEKLEQMLPYFNANTTLFTSLPQCDRSVITEKVAAARPFDTIESLGEFYNAALAVQTTADTEKYDIAFSEDFSGGISSAWTTLKQPAIVSEGSTFLGNSTVSLNISGVETSSAVFWGTSVSANNGIEKVTGDNITITRPVDPNSIISLYFYDYMNDKTAAIGFKINENVLVAAYGSNNSYMYSTDGGRTWTAAGVNRTAGWHKLVFDGITDSDLGLTTIYVDGNEVVQTDKDIENLSIGNFWSFAGYAIFAVDNITVAAKSAGAERVVVMDTSGNEITELGSNTKIRIMIENTKADKDYIIATYKNGVFHSLTTLTREQQEQGLVGTQLSLNGADQIKIFGWDSIDGMKPKTTPIPLN